MPKTKLQSVFFTALTAWLMVYAMTVYNTVLATGIFENGTFLSALGGMWVEYILIFLCAFFISSPIAKKLAFRIVKPGDRQIAIIAAIQLFTVIIQVAFASIIGVWHSGGLTAQFLPNYLTAYCRNFAMALPLQLFAVGPLARAIFRAVFLRKRGAAAQTGSHKAATE